MFFESKDEMARPLSKAQVLLHLRLSAIQRTALKREMALQKAGFRAKQDAALQIDFRLKDHKKCVILHDLRVEHKGRIAQIDRLIFHANWDFTSWRQRATQFFRARHQ